MFGVRPIEMIVQIVLSLRAVTYNLYNHFCPAELLPIKQTFANIRLTLHNIFAILILISTYTKEYYRKKWRNQHELW